MPGVIEFGSRSGSWFALVFFSAIFGAVGWAIARQMRIGSNGRQARLGRTIGALFFLGPVALVYWSMLSGFYEIEFHSKSMRLHYLFPGVVVETPLAHSSSRVVPAYRGRYRLLLSTDYGVFESTPWRRDDVMESLDRLNARVRSQ